MKLPDGSILVHIQSLTRKSARRQPGYLAACLSTGARVDAKGNVNTKGNFVRFTVAQRDALRKQFTPPAGKLPQLMRMGAQSRLIAAPEVALARARICGACSFFSPAGVCTKCTACGGNQISVQWKWSAAKCPLTPPKW